MTEAAERFIERVNRLESRNDLQDSGVPLANQHWPMPRELMIALRDELRAGQPLSLEQKREQVRRGNPNAVRYRNPRKIIVAKS